MIFNNDLTSTGVRPFLRPERWNEWYCENHKLIVYAGHHALEEKLNKVRGYHTSPMDISLFTLLIELLQKSHRDYAAECGMYMTQKWIDFLGHIHQYKVKTRFEQFNTDFNARVESWYHYTGASAFDSEDDTDFYEENCFQMEFNVQTLIPLKLRPTIEHGSIHDGLPPLIPPPPVILDEVQMHICQRAIELPDNRDKMKVGHATKMLSGSML